MRPHVFLLTMLSAYLVVGQSGIEKILSTPALREAKVSIAMSDMRADTMLYQHHADQALIPASTIKLITGITALNQLGASYRYRTEIGYTGELLADGTLVGDLYMLGSHDPTLGSDRIDGSPGLKALLRLMTKEVGQRITCIDGKVVVVASPSSYTPERYWLYEDLGNYYGSPSYAVNVDENEYKLYLTRSGKTGRLASIHHSTPDDIGMTWDCRVTTATKGGDQAYILGGPGQYHPRIVGTIPKDKGLFRIRGALPDPPAYFAQRWSVALDDYGIAHQGWRVDDHAVEGTRLTAVKSPPLEDIVRVMFQESHNLYTEAVYHALLSAGYTLDDVPDYCHQVDACGLSPRNRMSAAVFVDYLSEGQSPRPDLLASLPVAGQSGTMRSILQSKPYAGQIYAKSGSMTGVLCYAGYMNVKGKWRAFAILVNDYKGSSKDAKTAVVNLMKELYKVK